MDLINRQHIEDKLKKLTKWCSLSKVKTIVKEEETIDPLTTLYNWIVRNDATKEEIVKKISEMQRSRD